MDFIVNMVFALPKTAIGRVSAPPAATSEVRIFPMTLLRADAHPLAPRLRLAHPIVRHHGVSRRHCWLAVHVLADDNPVLATVQRPPDYGGRSSRSRRANRGRPGPDGPGREESGSCWSFLIDIQLRGQGGGGERIRPGRRISRTAALTRNAALMDISSAVEGKAAATDEAMKKVYEEGSNRSTGEQEVQARHILVETEDDAKALEEKLKKGADFAELAKKIQGSRRIRRRRPRLLHQGAMVLRIPAVASRWSRAHSRSGQVAVRLARHQGRGKARPQAPRIDQVKAQIRNAM